VRVVRLLLSIWRWRLTPPDGALFAHPSRDGAHGRCPTGGVKYTLLILFLFLHLCNVFFPPQPALFIEGLFVTEQLHKFLQPLIGNAKLVVESLTLKHFITHCFKIEVLFVTRGKIELPDHALQRLRV
jgi:hypothetical protein